MKREGASATHPTLLRRSLFVAKPRWIRKQLRSFIEQLYLRRTRRAAGWHCFSLWLFLAMDQLVGEALSGHLYHWGITDSQVGRFQLEKGPLYAPLVMTVLFVSAMFVTQLFVSMLVFRVCSRVRSRLFTMSFRCADWMTGARFAVLVSILLLLMKAWPQSYPVIGLLILSLEAIGAIRFIKRRMQGLADAGVPLCHQCGYDLRASGREVCPECGTNRVQARYP